ncbi:MAG: hypothetical protein BWY28_03061 [bacterium ADurb.Bin236]|nr:MAG: hypothetical protein BWY28_03061 [bacterium ADurb.Bin236]
MPTTPHSAAGCLMEPPVSEPSDIAHSHAATAAAEPPLDPPGALSKSHGFLVGWCADHSQDEPIANSSMLVFPTMTAPAAFNFSTTVASYGGSYGVSILDPHVVCAPRMHMLSFTATGIPYKGSDRSASFNSSARSLALSSSVTM